MQRARASPIPEDLVELIEHAYDSDLQKQVDFTCTIERHLKWLADNGMEDQIVGFIADHRAAIKEDAAAAVKRRRRAIFQVIAGIIVTAFLTSIFDRLFF